MSVARQRALRMSMLERLVATVVAAFLTCAANHDANHDLRKIGCTRRDSHLLRLSVFESLRTARRERYRENIRWSKGWRPIAHQHPQSITIDDERYPGRVANVVALDWAYTQIDRTTTLLLRGADGQFVVHMHRPPTGFDLIHAIDGGAALPRCSVDSRHEPWTSPVAVG